MSMRCDPVRNDPLSRLAQALFGPSVAIATADPGAPAGALPLPEAAAMARAVPARMREFAAGRRAARAAMAALGVPGQVLPMGRDRAPLWPEGLCGSISHGGGACIAVAGRCPPLRALGVDLEPARPLPAELWSEICTPIELDWLHAHPPARRGGLARIVFVAKEAAFKAQYAVSGALFGFDGLSLTLDPGEGAFKAHFTRPVPGFAASSVLFGRWTQDRDHLLAGVVLR